MYDGCTLADLCICMVWIHLALVGSLICNFKDVVGMYPCESMYLHGLDSLSPSWVIDLQI